jgi:hypothetical protein
MWPVRNLVSVRLVILLILTQDWCIIYTEQVIGSKIILDTPDGILGGVGHVKSRFGLFGDNISVNAR